MVHVIAVVEQKAMGGYHLVSCFGIDNLMQRWVRRRDAWLW
jgi:hypothetical protein